MALHTSDELVGRGEDERKNFNAIESPESRSKLSKQIRNTVTTLLSNNFLSQRVIIIVGGFCVFTCTRYLPPIMLTSMFYLRN